MARPKASKPRSKATNVRLTEEEHSEIQALATAQGFSSLSEYFRSLHTQFALAENPSLGPKRSNPRDFPSKLLRTFHKTNHGEILWGDSRSYLVTTQVVNHGYFQIFKS